MMINDENRGAGKRKARAVYLTLGVCLTAAAVVSAVSARSGLAPFLNTADETETVTYLHISDRATPETTAPATEPATAAPETQPPATAAPAAETQPPETAPVFDNAADAVTQAPTAAVFSPPISFRIGDDFSLGVPVFSDTMGDYRTHNGTDFPGERGAPVKAIGDGVVTEVKNSALFGNTVTVDHGGGVVSSVSGLADEGLIAVGETVTANAVIGVVGELPAEAKEGAHVHLEVRKDGALIDPLSLFGAAEAADD